MPLSTGYPTGPLHALLRAADCNGEVTVEADVDPSKLTEQKTSRSRSTALPGARSARTPMRPSHAKKRPVKERRPLSTGWRTKYSLARSGKPPQGHVFHAASRTMWSTRAPRTFPTKCTALRCMRPTPESWSILPTPRTARTPPCVGCGCRVFRRTFSLAPGSGFS